MNNLENGKDILKTILTHREMLLSFIRKKVSASDSAEDILQDSLLKALRSAPDLRDEEKLLPWFYKIVSNAVIDFYRQKSVRGKHLESWQDGHEEIPGEETEDATLLCSCFRELIPTLKPEYGILIEELDLQQGDPSMLARKLNIEPGNLKVRRHRARKALRKRLEETCRLCARHGCLDCTCRSGEV